MGWARDLLFGDADAASDAAKQAAEATASGQTAGLDYWKEREEIPRLFSEQGLRGLGGLYGMEGGTGSQQDLIDRAIASPLYGSLMGGQKAGEEAILRSASATGGLRSGNVQENLYDYNTQLQNQALLQSYNQQLQGLQGMAGLPSYAPQIAQGTAQIGQTYGQGIIAGEQAQQQGQQNVMGGILGLGQLGIAGYGAGMFSDRRLKNNIKKVGEVNGHSWFTWDWNIVAKKMGLKGKSEGVLADEVYVTNPESVSMRSGFMFVNYSKLGIFPQEVKHAS